MRNMSDKFAAPGAAVMFSLVIGGAVVAFGLMSHSSLALAGGCCSPNDQQAACTQSVTQLAANEHSGHAQHGGATENASDRAPAKEPMQPIPSVLDNYAKIEAALANDSLTGVPEAAQSISKLVAGYDMKMLPAPVATQADALAKAKDLAAARDAFKPLSTSLISYLSKEKVQTGRYYAAYCPMAKASWLQTDKAIKNPYYGKSMLTCGQITGNY